jgi:hypothetical protein
MEYDDVIHFLIQFWAYQVKFLNLDFWLDILNLILTRNNIVQDKNDIILSPFRKVRPLYYLFEFKSS